MTTHSSSDCGGYNVWIEIEVGNQICNTSKIDSFSAGDTLLWFGKYLGSCRDFEFGKDLEQINFKVKENNTGDDFCPKYFYAFVEGGNNFRSDEMAHESGDWYEYSKTNDRNHIARKTSGTFELPKSGKSFDA